MRFRFSELARKTASMVATQQAFAIALMITVAWLISGPIFHYNNTWQLIINTFTNVVTFLMVFLIQHTQNRDAIAMHKKVDELLRALGNARNELIDLENMSDEDLEAFQLEFQNIHRQVYARVKARVKKIEVPPPSTVPIPGNKSVTV